MNLLERRVQVAQLGAAFGNNRVDRGPHRRHRLRVLQGGDADAGPLGPLAEVPDELQRKEGVEEIIGRHLIERAVGAAAQAVQRSAEHEVQGGQGLVLGDSGLYAGVLDPGVQLQHAFSAGRRGWLQLIRGELDASGAMLSAGDGLSIQDTEILNLRAITPVELLVFDMDR